MKKSISLFTALLLTSNTVVFAKGKRKPSSVERPPQYVLFAFDGSKDSSFWQESVDFSKSVATNNVNKGNLLKFTYFVNPTYYTAPEYKTNYITPAIGGSRSCIGWSTAKGDIPLRVERTNNAFLNGHEIGSHANSHCDQSGRDKNNPMFGHPWTEADWTSEFSQFNKLLFGVFNLNRLAAPTQFAPTGLAFKEEDIVGFRAPLLATTDGLWPTLNKFKFRYDTSRIDKPTYWPQKSSFGIWNFPLAQIKIAGTSRTTLSMDYNWLFYHSAGASKPGLTETERLAFKNQMLDSYKYYFKQNYYGIRGPVNIGHHFSKWNGGAYWQAMREFAQFVCTKPEVKCVTYKEYADWLDSLDSNTLNSYRAGDFVKLPDDGSIKNIATPLLADVKIDTANDKFTAVVEDKDVNKVRISKGKVQLEINFEAQAKNSITRDELINKYGKGNDVVIRAALLNSRNSQINSSTYKITQLGTPEEQISGVLEEQANMPETADAHKDD